MDDPPNTGTNTASHDNVSGTITVAELLAFQDRVEALVDTSLYPKYSTTWLVTLRLLEAAGHRLIYDYRAVPGGKYSFSGSERNGAADALRMRIVLLRSSLRSKRGGDRQAFAASRVVIRRNDQSKRPYESIAATKRRALTEAGAASLFVEQQRNVELTNNNVALAAAAAASDAAYVDAKKQLKAAKRKVKSLEERASTVDDLEVQLASTGDKIAEQRRKNVRLHAQIGRLNYKLARSQQLAEEMAAFLSERGIDPNAIVIVVRFNLLILLISTLVLLCTCSFSDTTHYFQNTYINTYLRTRYIRTHI